jgi:DNA-binding FrmR family transcriptional regulator
MDAPSHRHKSHPEIVNRLKRIEGHLRSVVAMIEEGRPCLDIAQQLHAVEKAVAQAKRTLVHDHLDHCLESVGTTDARQSRRSLEEFKAISKYL